MSEKANKKVLTISQKIFWSGVIAGIFGACFFLPKGIWVALLMMQGGILLSFLLSFGFYKTAKYVEKQKPVCVRETVLTVSAGEAVVTEN